MAESEISDRAYHDTYYVVAHAHYLVSLTVATAIIAVIFFGVARLVPEQFRRLRITALSLWALGLLLAYGLPLSLAALPPWLLLDRPGTFAVVNAAATIGAFLAMIGVLLTVLAFVLAIVRRLSG